MIETSILFQGLAPELLEKIRRLCVRRRLDTGEVLFRKGEPGDALYGVVAGRVRIHATAADGRETMLNIMGRSDVFGEIALIDGLARTADATAIEPTELVTLRRQDFLPLVRCEGDLAIHLLELTCRRLRWVSDLVEDVTFLSPQARLAKRLLHLAKLHGRPDADGVRIDLKLPQRTIGELIGVSRETTNRHLKAWARLGWIALHRETVVIRMLRPLEELADQDCRDAVPDAADHASMGSG